MIEKTTGAQKDRAVVEVQLAEVLPLVIRQRAKRGSAYGPTVASAKNELTLAE